MKIEVPSRLWWRWKEWERAAGQDEITAYGIGDLGMADGVVRIGEILLPAQVVSGTSAVADADSLGRVFSALRDLCPDGVVWWVHSHVRMPAFWSGTDHKQLRELAQEAGLVLATVTNHQGESRSACAVMHEGAYLIQDEIALDIAPDPDMREAVQARIRRAAPKAPTVLRSMVTTDSVTRREPGTSRKAVRSAGRAIGWFEADAPGRDSVEKVIAELQRITKDHPILADDATVWRECLAAEGWDGSISSLRETIASEMRITLATEGPSRRVAAVDSAGDAWDRVAEPDEWDHWYDAVGGAE